MKLVYVLCILVSAIAFSDADHLLLTELCDTPSDSEFVEIYNPTTSSISLSYVHLTDLYGDSSCVEDFYPQIALGSISYQSSYDFLVKFPFGDEIAPGQVIVIAMSGSAFSGGNGITGHDETSENLSDTWFQATSTPGMAYTSLERDTWGSIKAIF